MTPIGSGCPRCRAERIKASPLPLIDGAISLFTRTHRYRCSACGWTGRRRRLKRRQHSQPSLAPRTTPVYLAAVPVAAMALVYLFYGFTVPADLAESFVGGSLPRILRIMPLDAVAGSLCGTALGFGFMRSFAIPQED